MAHILREQTFEDAILEALVETGGYAVRPAVHFSQELALDADIFIEFIQNSQSEKWERLETIHGVGQVRSRLLQRLHKELDMRGMIDVLRNGIVDYGVRFQLAFFKPESTLNPDTVALYETNRLTVMRQVHFSPRHPNKSIDLVLFVNGLPVATTELKNPFTGQTVQEAKIQYNHDRDPRELLLAFKKRALVHFAVDSEEVYYTTKLEGKNTYYLPFNKGYQNGAGNPPSTEYGYRTAYLWKEIWAKDSWMEIINRFIHLQSEMIEVEGRWYKKEKLIFPRYHQLDVVRQLANDTFDNGVGKNYLIQHSAGSGKSNSIAWLAYRLSSLHDAINEPVFGSVVVVTDRKVLDQQLQNTIYQFEHKTGVVQKIDKNSEQLAEALAKGTRIIITTLQKFPHILDKIKELPSRNYAVVLDEAHSSQGGEASKSMKEVLAAKSLEEAAAEESQELDDEEDTVRKSMEARGKQPNLSFYAFTATPKPKTLEVFGTPGDDGKPRPFHLYSMRQAIEEGFIMDVLQNYITYETYYRLSKVIEDDPEFSKSKATKAIGRFVSLHPHNISQKSEIMVEHFRQVTAKKIGGKAKAMVVTSSRLHALRYYLQFKKYIREKEYQGINALVAFSGKVIDAENGFVEGVTEPQLNGFGERELPNKFDSEEYQILLVADKYQTGFDQPLLHTMYVDKKLSGVKAVQTLSRLNRTHPGKEDTFILDFANDRNTILQSFQPYYEMTLLEERPDPNHLYDLKWQLDEKQVYTTEEVDEFSQIFFKQQDRLSAKDQGKLHEYINPAVERFKQLPAEEEQEEFKKALRTWLNLYSFVAQIMPFQDIEFEKFFAYGKLLLSKLPRQNMSERLKLTDEVALEYYRLQKVAEGAIQLESQQEYGLKVYTEAGVQREKEAKATLSEIIDILNERFSTDFTNADKLFFDQIEEELINDKVLQSQAHSNSMENFQYGFYDKFIAKLIERMEDNQEIFEKILDDPDFGKVVKEWMLKKVYRKIREG